MDGWMTVNACVLGCFCFCFCLYVCLERNECGAMEGMIQGIMKNKRIESNRIVVGIDVCISIEQS